MKVHRIALTLISLISFQYTANAQSSLVIPDPLKPWLGWVSQVKPEELCGSIGEQMQCLWPASLSLDVNAKGGTFALIVTNQDRTPVTLPGGKEAWPLQVRVDSGRGETPVPVASDAAGPQVFLEPGSHRITGVFSWDQTPDELMIPKEIGLVNLKANGVEEPGLNRLKDGRLSLREVVGGQAESKTGSVTLSVFRKISDGIPFQIRTRVLISASHERAQLTLHDPSPEGTRLAAVQSDLPYYSSGRDLTFGISGGAHTIEFLSVGAIPLSEVKVATSPDPWPIDETWLWEENRDVRVASLIGGVPVDPSIVGVPSDWQGIPSFLVPRGKSISIQQQTQTSPKQPESAITLQRTLVKDVQGSGFTIADELVGTLGGSGRLDLRAPAELGYVALDNTPQLITLAPQTQERGVEIRSQTFNVRATSRMAWDGGSLPAVGWSRDVDWLKVSILSPPGQELLWAQGADNSIGTRFSTWNLSTVFIVLLISIVTGMVIGITPGVAAGVCFALIHGDETSLMEVFFLAVLGIPILRRESADRRWTLAYFFLLLFFSVQAYQYTVTDLFGRVFPDVTAGGYTSSMPVEYAPPTSGDSVSKFSYNDDRISNASNALLTYAEGSFGALIMAAAGIMAIISLALRKFRWAVLAFAVAIGSFMLRSLTATFFDEASLGSSYYSSQIDAYNTIANERGLNKTSQFKGSRSESGSLIGASSDLSQSSETPVTRATSPVEGGQLTVQTGPGLPKWEGRQALLTWHGAVPKDLTIMLWYLPRWLGVVLTFVKAILVLYLIRALWRAIPTTLRQWVAGLARMVACLGGIALLTSSVATAQETFPPSSLLEELEKRVSEERNRARPCESGCVSTETARIMVSGRSLVLRSLVHSVGRNAWALPSSSQGALFSSVLVDGKNVEAARQVDGVTWLLLPNGVHTVEAKGATPSGDIISLSFQQSVGRLDFEAPEFKTFVDRSQNAPIVQLMRKAAETSQGADTTRPPRIEPWFLVERQISLTHEGKTSTSLARIGSLEQEEALSFRLLPTERILRGGEKQDGETVLVSFKPQETTASVDGIFNLQSGALQLEASGGERYSEIWRISCSEQWRCQIDGLQPTEVFEDGRVQLIVRPRPGEKSVLKFARPEGAQGTTQSVVIAAESLEPSTHFLKARTELVIRAGQNGVQRLNIPASATVRGFWVDDQDSTYLLNTSARPLELPIQRGLHTYQLMWQLPQEISWLPNLPPVDIGSPFTNGTVHYSVPRGWITLWTTSGSFGPRVTFWITLAVALIGFVVVSCFVALPCSRLTALVLFSGAWYIHVRTGIYMGTWLFICGILLALSKRSEPLVREWCVSQRFKWVRYLALFGPLALVGLWLQRAFGVGPDLGLYGVGTTAQSIRWYFDRGSDSLPIPHLLVVPPWVWQVTLLLWAVFAAVTALMIVRRVLSALALCEARKD